MLSVPPAKELKGTFGAMPRQFHGTGGFKSLSSTIETLMFDEHFTIMSILWLEFHLRLSSMYVGWEYFRDGASISSNLQTL